MLPTCDQSKATKTITNLDPLLCPLQFFYLTISCLTTMYRAYEHSDYPVVVFVVLIYAAMLLWYECDTAYSRLPKGEQSVKKELLRSTCCGLLSAILFGFAILFGTFMNLAAVVLMYCFAIASSLALFCVYYIHDDPRNSKHHHQYSSCSSSGKITTGVISNTSEIV